MFSIFKLIVLVLLFLFFILIGLVVFFFWSLVRFPSLSAGSESLWGGTLTLLRVASSEESLG